MQARAEGEGGFLVEARKTPLLTNEVCSIHYVTECSYYEGAWRLLYSRYAFPLNLLIVSFMSCVVGKRARRFTLSSHYLLLLLPASL